MNMTRRETLEYFERYAGLNPDKSGARVIFLVPYTAISTAVETGENLGFEVGAQNVYPAAAGAYTGEITADMIKDCGAKVVLVGHSERRTLFRESDTFINEKLRCVLDAGLSAILCVGETAKERENDETEGVLWRQITMALDKLPDLSKLIIAYEPVWAVGKTADGKSKKPATSQQIADAHAFIKTILTGFTDANDIPVLYGGNVKSETSGEIMRIPNVDGVLVGGASLKVEEFSKIIESSSALLN